MNYGKIFYWFLMFSFLLLSCSKDSGTFTITGKVVDLISQNNISNSIIEIHEVEKGVSKGIISKYNSVDNGNFSFEFNGKANGSYFITATNELYYYNIFPGPEPDNIYFPIKKSNEAQNYIIKLKPKSWLKLNIKSHRSYWNSISFYIYSFSEKGGILQWYSVNGETVDTTIVFPVIGGKTSELYYTMHLNYSESSELNVLSKFCPSFDTTSVNLTY